jgi:hypothetical protein
MWIGVEKLWKTESGGLKSEKKAYFAESFAQWPLQDIQVLLF